MTTAAAGAWLGGLGRVSAEAGVIVLLVLLVQSVLRKQLVPRWRSALWLLVVARLILPVSFGTPFSIFNLSPRLNPPAGKSEPPTAASKTSDTPRRSGPSPITPNALPNMPARNSPMPDDTSRPTLEPKVLPPPVPVQPLKAAPPIHIAAPLPIRPFPWVQVACAVWLGGALGLGAFVMVGSLRFSWRVARQPAITDELTLEILTDCRKLLRVGSRLDVVESSEISTPALYGFLRLRLLLPAGFAQKLSPAELQFVLLHELAHVKRRDIPLNWLITFLQVIHWFNPLLWFGFARWRADRELACDALALEAAGPALNKEYGRTILKLLEGFTQRVATPGLVGILENQSRLRQRIAMFAAFQPGNPWRFASVLLLSVLAVVCLTDAQSSKSSATATDVVITVQDEQGRPVPGAAIEYYQYFQGSSWARQSILENVKGKGLTDSKGELKLTALPNRGNLIVARKSGFASSWKMWPYAKEDFSEPLVLSAPTSLSGVVVDENGQPVADAGVWVFLTSLPQTRSSALPGDGSFTPLFRRLYSARATTDGRFRIENFPADTWAELSVTKAGFAQRTPPGNSLSWLRYQSGQQNIKLFVGPAGTVEGKVVEKETGRPVAGAELSLVNTNTYAAVNDPVKSGPDGKFRIPDLEPATYRVSAAMPEGSPLVRATENVLVTVAAGETNRDAIVHATTGALVEVTVVSTNDMTPLPDVAVSCAGSTAYTDLQGKALMRTLPGDGGFFASKIYWHYQNAMAQIDSGRTNLVLIQMVPPRRIVGVIRDSSGAPAPGVQVSFNPGRYPNAPLYVESTTDQEGRYQLNLREEWRGVFWSGPIDSTNIIMARDFSKNLVAFKEFGFDWRHSEEIGVIPTNADFVLQPGITISGSVKDTEGAPVPGAVVDLRVRSGNSYFSVQHKQTDIDAQGSFSYPALPRGMAYEAYDVTAKGYGTAIAEVKSENTQTNRYEIPALVLKRANRTVSGTVLDRDGHPVSGVQVQVNGLGQTRQRSCMSDDEGRFVVGPVCDGLVQVYASVNYGNNSESGDVAANGGDTNVVVHLGIRSYNGGRPPVRTAGTVRDNSGARLAGASISVFTVWSGIPLSSTADADGRYEVFWQMREARTDTDTWLLARDSQRNLATLQPLTSQPTNLDLALQPGLVLAMDVRDTDGRPVTNATAVVSLMLGTRGFGVEGKNFGTDAQGRLRIAGLPRGNAYQLLIQAPGYTTGNSRAGTGDTETNLLELPSVVLTATDGQVAGQVLDAEGKPAAGAQVQVFAIGKTVSTSTDANGRFELHNVSRGALNLNAGYPIRNSSALTNSGIAHVNGGDTNIMIRLGTRPESPDLRPNIKTSGTVFDPSGVGAAGVSIVVLPGGAWSNPDRSFAGGSYSAEWSTTLLHSPPWTNGSGKALLFARDVERNLAAAIETDPAVTNVDIHLLPGLTLFGMVQDSNGSPITNATVQVAPFPPADKRSAMNRMPAINANAQGKFSISALPQGAPYDVIVSASGYGLTNISMADTDTHLNQFELPVIILNPANVEISGQVFDPDGKPCWGARVFVDGDGQPARVAANDATSNADGHFTIRRVCPGALVVHAQLPASAQRRQYLISTLEARGGDTNVVLRLHAP